jgi:hypothetical protein
MVVFLQNECPNSRGNPIHGHPGGSNIQILSKNMQNIGIIKITSQFGPFDNAK